MFLLREFEDMAPTVPADGWSVGHLANLGLMLSCAGFTARFDLDNLNLLFDLVEDGEVGEVKTTSGKTIIVTPADDGVILQQSDDDQFPNGLLLDLDTLKEMGIEQFEEEESEFDPLDEPDNTIETDTVDDTISSGGEVEFDPLEEGVKRAYRRVGKKIKRGYRVTSGFRKGRVVSSPSGAYKPRKKASTRTKLRLAARRKKVIRILKGKMTRRKALSKRLVRMNKRIK